MSENRLRNPGGETHEEFDRDISIKGVVYTGAGLAALTVVSFVLMWFFFRGLASYEERRDPEPSPMPEASRPVRPAGPSLQATPERELEQLLALEHERLEGYGLSDDGESARVPIERAMEMVVARGIGTPRDESTETEATDAEIDDPETVGTDAAPAPPEGDSVPATEETDEERTEIPDSATEEGEDENAEGPDGV